MSSSIGMLTFLWKNNSHVPVTNQFFAVTMLLDAAILTLHLTSLTPKQQHKVKPSAGHSSSRGWYHPILPGNSRPSPPFQSSIRPAGKSTQLVHVDLLATKVYSNSNLIFVQLQLCSEQLQCQIFGRWRVKTTLDYFGLSLCSMERRA